MALFHCTVQISAELDRTVATSDDQLGAPTCIPYRAEASTGEGRGDGSKQPGLSRQAVSTSSIVSPRDAACSISTLESVYRALTRFSVMLGEVFATSKSGRDNPPCRQGN